jgi:hypothetical protein
MALEKQQKDIYKKGKSACCPSVVTARHESNLSEVVTSPEKRHLFNIKKKKVMPGHCDVITPPL